MVLHSWRNIGLCCVGYIFFGSAIAISDKLVAAAKAMLAEDAATMTGVSKCVAYFSAEALSNRITPSDFEITLSLTESGALSTLRAGRRVRSSGALIDDNKSPLEQRAKAAVAESPRFVVLDFRRGLPALRLLLTLHHPPELVSHPPTPFADGTPYCAHTTTDEKVMKRCIIGPKQKFLAGVQADAGPGCNSGALAGGRLLPRWASWASRCWSRSSTLTPRPPGCW